MSPVAAMDHLPPMRRALTLARRGYGRTSPNPMVGALVVRDGAILGEGWHRGAGLPHAEVEALRDCRRQGHDPRGAVLYVTLEPCCTHGRTPPCTDAILEAGLRTVVVAATDPNPRHAGRGLDLLRAAGVEVLTGVLERESARLNEAFHHWIVRRTPFVVVKAAMTLDGKIATRTGESKWITGERARAEGMRLRQGSDAILVGVNTVLADDPSLTRRGPRAGTGAAREGGGPGLRRIILDGRGRTPVTARVVTDAQAALTTVVVTERAPAGRVRALEKRVRVWRAPTASNGGVDLDWLLRELGGEGVTQLLVEGGGEVNGAFFDGGHVQRVAFFYGSLIVGGKEAVRGVGGVGAGGPAEVSVLTEVRWRRLGEDWYLTARVGRE